SVLNVATLHKDRIFDDCALADGDAAEDNAVLDGAANLATVSDERILNVSSLFVLNGNFVLNLRENRAFAVHEEFFPNFGLEAVAVRFVIFHGGIDMSNVAFMFVRADFEFAGVANKRVEEEVLTAAFISRTNEISERRDGHEIRAHNVFLSRFDCGNFCQVGDNAVRAGFDNDALALAVSLRFGVD
ncbi:hypothetical protein DCD76_18455, partial [Acinetobacter baumannii]